MRRGIAVAVVLLIGLWLRAHDVGVRGLSMDESGSLWASRGDSALECMERVRAVHGQSALYYLVVRAVTRAFGETEATLRLPSVIAGALVPLLGFLAVGRGAGRRAGALALVLLAVDPALIAQSRLARPYALAELASAVALAGLAFALVTGSARARLALWGGAAAAVYAHSLFLPLVPALALGAVLARSERYGGRAVLLDAALAVAAMTPELLHVARLFARREELAWLDVVDSRIFGLLLPSGTWYPCLVAAGYVLVRRVRFANAADRGTSLSVAAGVAAVGGSVLALLAVGTNIVADRYLSAAFVFGPALAARVLAVLPRWLAAAALVFAVAVEAPVLDRPRPPQEWREAADYLDALAARSDGAVLLNPGFVEQNLLVRPGRTSPERRAFIAAPFECRPGRPESRRAVVLLPKNWGVPGERDYFEREVVPALAGTRAFCVAGRAPYVAILEDWLRLRFPDRSFRRTDGRDFSVAEFRDPLRVARYEVP